jgi:hypothetical protein
MNTIRKFLHDKLGWGYPQGLGSNNSFQPSYSCRYCSGQVASDSTGAWFHLSDYGQSK